MPQMMAFGEVLEAADQLSLDEQEALIEILHRRLAQAGRQRVVAEVKEAQAELAAGKCAAVAPDDLILIASTVDQPQDEWERRLFGLAKDCDVSLSDTALSRETLYE